MRLIFNQKFGDDVITIKKIMRKMMKENDADVLSPDFENNILEAISKFEQMRAFLRLDEDTVNKVKELLNLLKSTEIADKSGYKRTSRHYRVSGHKRRSGHKRNSENKRRTGHKRRSGHKRSRRHVRS